MKKSKIIMSLFLFFILIGNVFSEITPQVEYGDNYIVIEADETSSDVITSYSIHYTKLYDCCHHRSIGTGGSTCKCNSIPRPYDEKDDSG